MKLLKTIRDVDVFGGATNNPILKERNAARAVVIDEKSNKLGMVYVSKFDYYKIPGGGIEENENIEEALDRECMEEIGRHIDVIDEIGIITEYREKHNLKQDSFCYLAKTTSDQFKPNFTEDEIGEGFQLIWIGLNEAIEKQKNCKPKDYQGAFIKVRELTFLEEAKKKLNL